MWPKLIMILTPVAWKIADAVGERLLDWAIAKLQGVKAGVAKRAEEKTRMEPPVPPTATGGAVA